VLAEGNFVIDLRRDRACPDSDAVGIEEVLLGVLCGRIAVPALSVQAVDLVIDLLLSLGSEVWQGRTRRRAR
jgi:hypothetical protein